MFFYLSFLRAPPSEAPPSGTVSITPQVANDLRTEPFADELDIYYAWLLEPLPSPLLVSALPAAVVPRKLTKWRITTSIYKEITVPLPENTRVGQAWRLVLTAQCSGTSQPPYTIDLNGEHIGTSPFAVLSMPVKIVDHLPVSPRRQTHIQRIFRFPAGDRDASMHAMIVKEDLSFDLDKKIWDSGVGLSSWLVDLRNGSLPASNSEAIAVLRNALFSPEKRKIIELGTGSGIVSITLSALRASLGTSHEEDSILATDLPSAMPLLQDNINANQHLPSAASLRATVLNWDDDNLPETVVEHGGYHVIIMSDVSYNTSSFPSLMKTIASLLDLQPKDNPPVLLIGYKKRDSSERLLWENMIKNLNVAFERVGKRKGAGGATVSVYVGRVQSLTQ